MSTAPFEQAIAAARGVLTDVKTEQLTDSTPCASWNVAGLINHLIGAQDFFLAGIEGRPPSAETDFAAGDYVASFDEMTNKAVTAFQGDGVLQQMFELPFGTMPGAAILGMASTDTFCHAWDLAKATGQSTDLNPALAEQLLAQSKMSIQEAFRGPEGAPFGTEQQAGDGATKADELAAFLGRSV